jgi:hypothetical protein
MFVLTNSDFAEKNLVCIHTIWKKCLFVVQLIYTWFFIYSIHLFIYEYLNNYYVRTIYFNKIKKLKSIFSWFLLVFQSNGIRRYCKSDLQSLKHIESVFSLIIIRNKNDPSQQINCCGRFLRNWELIMNFNLLCHLNLIRAFKHSILNYGLFFIY